MNTTERELSVSDYIAIISDATARIEHHRNTQAGSLDGIKMMIGYLAGLCDDLEAAAIAYPDFLYFNALLCKISVALMDAVRHYRAAESALMAEARASTIH